VRVPKPVCKLKSDVRYESDALCVSHLSARVHRKQLVVPATSTHFRLSAEVQISVASALDMFRFLGVPGSEPRVSNPRRGHHMFYAKSVEPTEPATKVPFVGLEKIWKKPVVNQRRYYRHLPGGTEKNHAYHPLSRPRFEPCNSRIKE
jgi:hypothetical protein